LKNVGEYGIRYCATEEYGGVMVRILRKIMDSFYGEGRKLLERYETAGHTEGRGVTSYLLRAWGL
jgi:hypothetical protein